MTSSTVRTDPDPTIGEVPAGTRPAALRLAICAEWRQSGQADLVVVLRRHPNLLRERSLLLELAVDEYKAQHHASGVTDLEQHCQRFREFGSSIQGSILRQLEVQRFLDGHSELLELLSTPRWPNPGENFGDFSVREELGRGAAAHVYLCLQRDVGDRQVVVKATPFSSIEASVLGRLSHPNIVPIYSTGFVGEYNLHYLCMPYCGRSTLSDVLDVAFQDGCPRRGDCIANAAKLWTREKDWPVDKGLRRKFARLGFRTYVDGVLSLAIQIADALDRAHKQGILHGDLKPSNVLLTPGGQPLLLDFNLSQDYTNSSEVCGGTLAYMPPEHLRLVAGHYSEEQSSAFDATPDIYSFGALLFELLAGETPVTIPADVDDSSVAAESLLNQLKQGVPSIRQRNCLVGRRLEALVLRCLAFDRANRPKSMAEVKRQLQAELRSLAAMGRTARVRPILFSAIVGLPLAVFSGAATYVAIQPPRYLANYEEGLRLVAGGNSQEAAKYFAASIDANPSFTPARLERARTLIGLGELDLALDEFYELARTGDAHSMAYLGYCFNLKSLHTAAIPWYQRAVDNGAASAAIYNNLGTSYLKARTTDSTSERMRLAERYLFDALKLDQTSTTIQLNIVRLATVKATINRSSDPWSIWRHAKAILDGQPNDPLIRFHVALWYDTVTRSDAASDGLAGHTQVTGSEEEMAAHHEFAQLHRTILPRRPDAAAIDKIPSPDSGDADPISVKRRYFLEPFSLGDVQK